MCDYDATVAMFILVTLFSRFCAVLDSSKTGKTVRPEVLRRDRLKYHGK